MNAIPTCERQSTSVASRDLLNKKRHNYRASILAYITRQEGSTCDEVEVVLNLRHQTASCFIRFMTQEGVLKDSGSKRLTRSGRTAIVWIPTPQKPFDPQRDMYLSESAAKEHFWARE